MKTLYEKIEWQINEMVNELTYYFDGYYTGVEHDITDKYLTKVKQIILDEELKDRPIPTNMHITDV